MFRFWRKKEDSNVRYVIRVTTYLGPDRLPKFSRVCDEEGVPMLYSKGSAEDTAQEMREINPDVKYDVIPDPNAKEE